MLRIVLIKTRNVQIPTMKIRQIEYKTVNKALRQLRPEQYFPEFFKSRAQIKLFKIFL